MKKRELFSDPPLIPEHHIRLPEQAAELLQARRAHENGITGQGIRVAVIDSGFFPHPYYLSRGYQIHPVATESEPNPLTDEYGHGTATLASLFAVAPGAEVYAIKCMERDPSGALRKAIELKPHILNCAWGFDIDRPTRSGKTRQLSRRFHTVHALLQKAVSAGITIVASAGNGQHAFPGCMPEVISAGGVYYASNGTFSASDASSRYESAIFPGRIVPDVCALSGKLPYGRLLLVPVPPRALLARRHSFAAIADGNPCHPKSTHGWAMFSGTSAAACMVSGAIALILQAKPDLSPTQIKELLIKTARTVDTSDAPAEHLIDVQAALAHLGL